MIASLGMVKPLRLRSVNPIFLEVNGRAIPPAIAEYLSQFDNVQLVQSNDEYVVWSCSDDLLHMHETHRNPAELQERFLDRIITNGGMVVDLPNEEQRIGYPRNQAYMCSLFAEVHFGFDDYGHPATGLPVVKGVNSPSRVQARREDAIRLFNELAMECPIVVTRIGPTSASVRTIEKPNKEWAKMWAENLWNYYLKHKSEHLVPEMVDSVHSFTKRECFRLAREHGVFLFGGY